MQVLFFAFSGYLAEGEDGIAKWNKRGYTKAVRKRMG